MSVDGERYYRSGDICRWLPGGVLHYVGRNDEQVKVSGFRINLNEIKRVLDSAPWVREGHPIVLTHEIFGKVIGACILGLDGSSENDDLFRDLQLFFKEGLPYYMVPTLYFLFDAFPKLPSGKTDKNEISRLAMAAVEGADTRLTRFDCRCPRTVD